MSVVRNKSIAVPNRDRLPRLTFEAARRAEAMGIVDPAPPRADAATIRQFAGRVRRAGIAANAADLIHNVESPSDADLAALLETIVAALEASPVPKYEWRGLARVFAP